MLELQGVPGGVYLKLRFEADVRGPCYRCLEDAAVHVSVNAAEYHEPAGERGARAPTTSRRTSSTPSAGRATRWCSRFRPKILCRPDCAGLCPRCGVRLEQGVEHGCGEEEADPRWEKLRSWRGPAV